MVLTSVQCPTTVSAAFGRQRVAPFPWLLLKPQHQGALFGGYRCGNRSPLSLIPNQLSRGLTRGSVRSKLMEHLLSFQGPSELLTADQTEGKENQCWHPLNLTLEVFCPYFQAAEQGMYLIPPLSKHRPPKGNHGPVGVCLEDKAIYPSGEIHLRNWLALMIWASVSLEQTSHGSHPSKQLPWPWFSPHIIPSDITPVPQGSLVP